MIALMLADREEARHVRQASLADAHRRGSLFAAPGVNLWRGYVLRRRGELAEAEELLVRASQGSSPGASAG